MIKTNMTMNIFFSRVVITIILPLLTIATAWAQGVTYTSYTATAGTAGATVREGYASLLDNDTGTKWCVTSLSNPTYIEFKSARTIIPTGYTMTTCVDTNTYPYRNPRKWTVKAKVNDTDAEWTVIDSRDANTNTRDALPTTNSATKTYTFNNNTAYQYFRLEITAVTDGSAFQLSEFQFQVSDDNTNLNNGGIISGLSNFYKYNNGAAISLGDWHVVDCKGNTLTNSQYTYTITNSSNETVTTITAKGTYTLNVTGLSPYSGTVSKTFTVSDFIDIPDGMEVDFDFTYPEAGYLYVNMPATGTNTLTLNDATITTFKVYDDGGKNGNYSDYYSGYLVLTAPVGYVLQLSGSITTRSYDYLTVYDGSDKNSTTLLDGFSSSDNGIETAINTVTSTGRNMTIYFKSYNFGIYAGLDLTVTLANANTDHTITVNTATGGSVAASVGGDAATTAKANQTVTLTVSPESGYMLSHINVVDAANDTVSVTGGWHTNNQVTFTMPPSAVTVTPTFTNTLTAAGGLYITMPTTDTKTVTIPSDVQSLKVYDDGGSTGNYSNNCAGTLVLTAPEGYVLRLSGSMITSYYDYLTVYDGSDDNGTTLLNHVGEPEDGETVINTVTSTGRSMTLYFLSNYHINYAGLDLTVTLINTSNDFNITVCTATGGSVAASIGGEAVTTAQANQTVTLTASPENGYMLSQINVVDATNNTVGVTGGWYSNNQVTFNMPASDVTITPKFINNTIPIATGLYIYMPTTGTKTATIPSGVQSFLVYDDGGGSNLSSNNCDGTLVLIAPEGYVLQLSGSITTDTEDYLTVYDGSDNTGTKLLDQVNGDQKVITVSTGRSMTLYYYTDPSDTPSWGLDLTVTLVNPNTDYNITVNSATGGSVAASVGGDAATTAKANQTVTLTASPESGYVLNDLTVVDADKYSVAVTDMLWYNDATTATFTMHASAVTVTPKFTNTLTASGGLYINMPTTGTKTVTIPSGVQSFKVYDDGGSAEDYWGRYSDNCDGTLELIAPEGYVLQLSGSITTDTDDYLTIDYGTFAGFPLHEEVSSSDIGIKTAINTVTSSGRSMTLHFYSDTFENYAGLDLTVTLVNPNSNFKITVNTATGGSVAASVGGDAVTRAEVNQTVTLTASPETGYVLSQINVVDAENYAISVKGGWYTNNQVTFTMPGNAVTVTPTFTNTLTAAGGLYITMPTTGTKTANIPLGVQSFKVYDDGGSTGKYSNNCDGTLVLTAPEGYLLQLSGSMITAYDDFLTVYDGSDDNGTTLLDRVSSSDVSIETAINTVTSTDRSMTLYFYSDDSENYAGHDLTVTLLQKHYTVSFNANGGSGDAMAVQTFNYGVAQNLTANTYTRTGYTFAGWATSADGEVVYTDGQSVQDLTTVIGANIELFAKWTENILTLLDDDSNSNTKNTTVIGSASDDGKQYNVTLSDRTLYSDGDWNTLCLPFSLSSLEGTPLEGFTVMELDTETTCNGHKTGLDGSTLYLNFKDTTSIVAGRPYIVKRASFDTQSQPYTAISGTAGFDNEDYANLVDGDVETKWCSSKTQSNGDAWVCEFSAAYPICVTSYTLTTCDDAGTHMSWNPYIWTLKAKMKVTDAEWAVIDSRNTIVNPNECLPPGNLSSRTYDIADDKRGTYRYFRFEVSQDIDNTMQIAELQLLVTDIQNPTFKGVSIVADNPTAVTSEDGKVTFVGNYDPFEINASNIDEIIYLGSENVIGYASAPMTLRAFRAHFEVPMTSNSRTITRAVLNFGDGEMTRIAEIDGDANFRLASPDSGIANSLKREGWYTIDGRKLTGRPSQKGLYIHNGMKVTIK